MANILDTSGTNGMLFRFKMALYRAKKSAEAYHKRSLVDGEFAGIKSELYKEIEDAIQAQVDKLPGPTLE